MGVRKIPRLSTATDLELLLQSSPVAIFMLSVSGAIEYANPFAENMFGYAANELGGYSFYKLIPDFKADGHVAVNTPHRETRYEPPVAEYWAVQKNGQKLRVEVDIVQRKVKEKNFLATVSLSRAHQLFSDDKFRVIFYKSPVAKALSEFETGKLIDVNERFCHITGYAREELVGYSATELKILDPEKRKEYIRLIRHNGSLTNNEIEIITKNRNSVFALISTEQIELESRKYILSTVIDITEQKKTALTLERAKKILEWEAADLKLLLETGNNLWRIDNLRSGLSEVLKSSLELTRADKGDIQLYDPVKGVLVLEQSIGFTEEFLTHFHEVSANDNCACGMALKKRAQVVIEDTELEWDEKEAAIARNEDFRSCQSTPLLFRDGKPMGMISTHFTHPGSPPESVLKKMELYALVAENFLERIQMHETLKQSNVDLEEKVFNRTQELIDALENEKFANDMKSKFVSMASHEFRTPLTTILSSTALLKHYHSEAEKEKRDKHIGRIETSVSSLVDILNDFLSLDRLNHGKIEASFANINFQELTQDVIDEMSGLLKNNQHICLSYKGSPEIFQDKKILQNVLRNLLSNAIKYSGEGTEITVSVSEDSGMIKLEVADQGIGISEEDQEHIFSSFFRSGNVSTIQGTGLGLNIVKRYVQLLNGEISFTSQLNIGSTFTVNFPVISQELLNPV